MGRTLNEVMTDLPAERRQASCRFWRQGRNSEPVAAHSGRPAFMLAKPPPKARSGTGPARDARAASRGPSRRRGRRASG